MAASEDKYTPPVLRPETDEVLLAFYLRSGVSPAALHCLGVNETAPQSSLCSVSLGYGAAAQSLSLFRPSTGSTGQLAAQAAPDGVAQQARALMGETSPATAEESK
jgi:hypothetical protein